MPIKETGMKIAIASGKGGTGKTLVAVNLALSVKADQVIDCDVEEPNVHIFLKPTDVSTNEVELLVPDIDESKCTYCRRCAEFCQFNALFIAGETSLVFPELCHSCGGCKLVCPVNAISEKKRSIGKIYSGKTGEEGLNVVYGELKIGEPLAVPVISSAKEHINDDGLVIIDSPPGSACPVVESVHGADFCIMVTEPTPFGLHDLEIASEVVSQLGIPLGVVVNFAGIGDKGVYEFCAEKNIPILLEIPFDRRIAELYSKGIAFTEKMPEWRVSFQELLSEIKRRLK